MKELDYGKDYRYPHDYNGGHTTQDYLPEELKGHRYYQPTERGYEKTMGERLRCLQKQPLPSASTPDSPIAPRDPAQPHKAKDRDD
jgi:putative ATPase